MSVPLPSPTDQVESRTGVFLGYLDYFRDRLLDKINDLPEQELRHSRLPSGWTPLELLKHLRHVERRWLEWGFEGLDIADPWADRVDDRWYVAPDETLTDLASALESQAARTRSIVESHRLTDIGQPSDRWDGAAPPPLERVLFHLLQEYARHVGHIDIVSEISHGSMGE